jgi:hypothetical protein
MPLDPMVDQQPAVVLDNASLAQVTYQRPVEAQDDAPLGLVPFDVFQKFAQGYLQLWFHGLIVQQLRDALVDGAVAPVHPFLLPDEVKKTVAVQDEQVKKAVEHFKRRVSQIMDFIKSQRNGSPIPPSTILDHHVGNLPTLAILLPSATIEGLALPHYERAAKFRPDGLTYDKDEQTASKTKKRKSIPLSNKSGATATIAKSKTSPSHRTQRARKKSKPSAPLSKKNGKRAPNTNNIDTSNDHYHEVKNINKARSHQHLEVP